jgi:hypothetical protein
MDPSDDAMRQWAREQMKDSRFMYLPADLLRLLICYVRDAAIAEHCAKPIEVAKALILNDGKPEIRNCKCGAIFAIWGRIPYGGVGCARYDCETYECNCCMKHCDSCNWGRCAEHTIDCVTKIHTCEVCKHTQCDDCIDEDMDYICSRCERKLCGSCVEYIPSEGNAMICDQVYGCMVRN